jgi:hypothetical protein
MRAVTVTKYGATPTVTEMPTPERGPGQVLIRLRAGGMNPMDRGSEPAARTPACGYQAMGAHGLAMTGS